MTIFALSRAFGPRSIESGLAARQHRPVSGAATLGGKLANGSTVVHRRKPFGPIRSSPTDTGSTATAQLKSEVDPAGFEGRLRDAMNAEIEAAVHAVHDAVEVELEGVSSTLQDTVADAVEQALDKRATFDLRANFNTLVALTGIVIFERGVWTAWDVIFGDSLLSELASISVGLCIMIAIGLFDIPLAEWRRPNNVSD